MSSLIKNIDNFNSAIGKAVSWLTLIMVIGMCVTVVQRYLFQTNFIWQHELVRFMHGAVFLLGSAYTLKAGGHVRVDVLYERMSEKGKALVNLIGTFIFLYPVCVALLYFSWDFVLSSWSILEESRESGGMKGIFILKSCIWGFAVLLILQGMATILKSIERLRGKTFSSQTEETHAL